MGKALKHYLCTVDYHSKSQVIKWVEGFNIDNLIEAYKILFVEYGFQSKLMSDTDINSISEMF